MPEEVSQPVSQPKKSFLENVFSPERIQVYKCMAFFSFLAILFGAIEIAYQYFFLITPSNLDASILRGAALTGVTLIGIALLLGPVAKLFPQFNFVQHRRMFGIWGFIFIFLHVNTVIRTYFGGNFLAPYQDLNPFQNPIIWGAIAMFIFFLMFLTSNDFMQFKVLGFKNWQLLHRLVYFAFIFSVLHFGIINPSLLFNLAGGLVLLITLLVFLFELIAFFKTIQKKQFKSLGTVVGVIIILFALVLFYFSFPTITTNWSNALKSGKAKDSPSNLGSDSKVLSKEEFQKMIDSKPKDLPMETAVEEMKKLMKEGVVSPFTSTETVKEDSSFKAVTVKSGQFENINYMTSGKASLQKEGEKYSIVFEEDFSTPNGPDLVVYLTKNSEKTTREDIKVGIELGKLKSIKGKQVYELPAETNISEFNSVSIHCKAFNVPWSFARFSTP